jgi:MerR family transcriptional regulator, thiopeptide resistance regulator
MDRHLSPSETVRRFGVSIKALRLYEQRGLLTPLRSAAGWRTYGPAQIARLHQILALKRLGLPLVRIGELLNGTDGLDRVLAFQEQVLARQSVSLSRALSLVKAARHKLASGQALSIDDLATLTKETVMPNITDEERMQLLKPISEKYFSKEDAAALKQRKYDRPAIMTQWNTLFAEAKGFVAANADPASPPVQDLARRWRALIEQFTGGDDAMLGKIRSVWKDAMADPQLAPIIPLTPDVSAFIRRAQEHLKKDHQGRAK